jgi:4-amino-4-deoxy-L-arabinose transferase-like glycosyltransferase
VVLIAALWGRERKSLALLGPRWGWAAFVAVAVPWFVVVTARTPGLMSYLLTHQIWERYATQTHQRGGPPWYFVAVLIVGALPWTPALIAGLARLWRERSRAEARLLFCWLIAPLVFFSSSGSKLPAYLLPCLPAAALIAALGVQKAGRLVRWSGALSLVLLAIAGWILGPRALEQAVGGSGAAGVVLPLAAHIALGCLVIAAAFLIRARAVGAAVMVLIGLSAATVAAARYEGPIGSPRPLVRLLAELRTPVEPVVELKHFNAGLPFYLREPVRLLDVPRETGFEERGRRVTVIVTRDSIASWTAQHPRVWVFGPRAAAEELALGLGLDYQPVARWRKETLGTLSR